MPDTAKPPKGGASAWCPAISDLRSDREGGQGVAIMNFQRVDVGEQPGVGAGIGLRVPDEPGQLGEDLPLAILGRSDLQRIVVVRHRGKPLPVVPAGIRPAPVFPATTLAHASHRLRRR